LPLAIGRSLVLLQNIDDFDLDGYVVLPRNDVASVRSDESERFVERVLRDEGELRNVSPPPFPVALDSWAGLFSTIAAAGEIIIVECEANPDEDFCIGVVTGVTDGAVGIHQFDFVAMWDDAPTVVAYDDITRVRFGDRYSRVFPRYLHART